MFVPFLRKWFEYLPAVWDLAEADAKGTIELAQLVVGEDDSRKVNDHGGGSHWPPVFVDRLKDSHGVDQQERTMLPGRRILNEEVD